MHFTLDIKIASGLSFLDAGRDRAVESSGCFGASGACLDKLRQSPTRGRDQILNLKAVWDGLSLSGAVMESEPPNVLRLSCSANRGIG